MNIGFYDDGYFNLHRYLCSVMIHSVSYFADNMNTFEFISRIAKHSPLANDQVCSVHFFYVNISVSAGIFLGLLLLCYIQLRAILFERSIF